MCSPTSTVVAHTWARMLPSICIFFILCLSASHARLDPEEPLLYESFPDNFLWGVASSAYQVEDGWSEMITNVQTNYCTMGRTTIAPFESLGKKLRKTYLSNKSQSLNQVEGGWDEDGKGLSNWDKWTEDPSHTTDGSSGKVFFFSSKKIYLEWKGVSGQLPQVQGGCAARS